MIPLRTLILEDSPESVVILVEQLRRGGYEPSFERVDSPQDFAEALERHPWDIVFSDHALGHFNSLEALRMVRERGLTMPFIVVSGATDEEIQEAILKAGVNDFIPKGQTARLPTVVERELQAARDRAELQRLSETLAQYRLFFELAPIACQTLDAAGRLVEVNPAWLKWLGYERAEVIDRWWGSLLPAEQADGFRHQLEEPRGAGALPRSEVRVRAKDGQWLAATARGMRMSEGAGGGTCWVLTRHSEAAQGSLFDEGEFAASAGQIPDAGWSGGFLPTCMYCKKIRETDGRWHSIETFFENHTDYRFSHGVCPDCVVKFFHDLTSEKGEQGKGGGAT